MIDAVGFTAATFGRSAPATVLARFAPEAREVFAGRVLEGGWYPLAAFVSYLVTARQTLAPSEREFYRRQGRYAGERQRSFIASMISVPETAMRMAPTIWRMYYDVGRLVVVGDSPATAACQIHGFPTTPELCERFRGSWEGASATPDRPTEATETLCTLRGDPYCEIRVTDVEVHPGHDGTERPGD